MNLTPQDATRLARQQERQFEEVLKFKVYNLRDQIKELYSAYEVRVFFFSNGLLCACIT